MSSSLGLYIEENLIKYAKVSKNNDNIKVESFGIKFYDKPEDAIKQIIEETYSYKIPISTNSTEEIYNYFDIFSELKPKDIDGIVKTSFENYCYDNGLNKDSFESRHIQSNSPISKEKKREICISTKKTSIARRKNQLSGYKISNISPISVSIGELVNQRQQTSIVVNLEENTTITKIGPEGVKDIRIIPTGSKDILEKIKAKENSYSKAYEICKNTSIYTNDAYDLQVEENEFLPDIMPALFEIVTAIKNYIGESLENIEKVYITGTLSIINNIDIYFQEYIKNIKCEISKPYFVSNNSKINIKDYIEVNSALALALYDLNTKKESVNFIKESGVSKLFGQLGKSSERTKLNEIDIWNVIDKNKGVFTAVTTLTCSALVIYIASMITLNAIMNNKQKEAQDAITDTNTKISEISNYNTILNNRITKYKNMIKAIEDNNDKNSENLRYKNIIPNFMNNIMAVIPKEVQLTSMSNTNDTHIVLEATSSKYEQLAYFKTKIKTEGILDQVTSDTGVASGGSIKVTIEGELP